MLHLRSSSLPAGPRRPATLQLLDWVYRPTAFMRDCAQRFGDLFTVRFLGVGDVVFVSSPEGIRQVFTGKSDVLHAGEANQLLGPLVGPRSVLLLDDAEHLRQRRLLLPPFHGERMQTYANAMRDITAASVDGWPRDRAFSLHPLMQSITLDVILRTIFGMHEGAEMRHFAALNVELFTPPPALVAFLPMFMPVEYGDFPFSPYRKFLRARQAVDRELYAMIARRRGTESHGEDVLSLLLAARDEAGQPMSDDELRDELMTMIAAGHETTATSLSFAFERLLANPSTLRPLLDELAGATDEQIPTLPYLDAVVKETMRLRPVFPIVVRRLKAEFELCGHTLSAGTYVAPCVYLAHLRPETYPDPERFSPERFLGKKIDPYAWLPFGGGIRRCIGWAFAEYEMKIVLATVLRKVRLRLADGPAKVVRRAITLAPEHGTRVVASSIAVN